MRILYHDAAVDYVRLIEMTAPMMIPGHSEQLQQQIDLELQDDREEIVAVVAALVLPPY